MDTTLKRGAKADAATVRHCLEAEIGKGGGWPSTELPAAEHEDAKLRHDADVLGDLEHQKIPSAAMPG